MHLSDNQLWLSLKNKQLVTQELVVQPPKTAWYIRTLLGIAAWHSACFLFAFLAYIIFSAGGDNGFVLVLVGGVSSAVAFSIFKSNTQSVFARQMALAFNLSGQLLIGIGMYWLLDDLDLAGRDSFATLCAIFFVLQLMMSFIMPDYLSRVMSSWFAMIALFLLLKSFNLAVLCLPLVAVLFICVWLFDERWLLKGVVWEPIGYGLALSLVIFSGELFGGLPFYEIMRWLDEPIGLVVYSEWLSALTIALCFSYLLKVIGTQYQITLSSKMGAGFILLGILLSLISYVIAGASAGLLLIIIGFFKQRRLLVGLGICSLVGFVSWYYYSLNWTLLYKSIVLIGLGGCLAAVLFIINLVNKKALGETSSTKDRFAFNVSNLIAAAMVAIILGALNFNIYQKETILDEGKIVLLKLAPVDPRSIMQGDYMRLRFAIERRISNGEQAFDQGLFVVDLDAFEVARYNSLYTGQALTENQVKMQYRIRDQRLQLATHAFFFQEGTASAYEAATYGEFRVAENGELLLNALRDKERKVIGYHRPGN